VRSIKEDIIIIVVVVVVGVGVGGGVVVIVIIVIIFSVIIIILKTHQIPYQWPDFLDVEKRTCHYIT
jgi:hypothetical protein